MLRQTNASHFGLLLVGLMWLLPFLSFRHLLPIPSFYGELVAAALGLAAMAILLRREVWQPFELPQVALLPLGLVGLILLQFVAGRIVYPQQALLGMLYLIWAMLLMALGAHLRRVFGWERVAGTLAWFLLVGGVLGAFITASQFLGWQGVLLVPKRFAQSYGNLGQANHFADYMALALASLVYLDIKRRLPPLMTVVLALAFLAALALSGSRSSWLYLLTFAGTSLLVSRHSGRRHLLVITCLLLPVFLLIQQLVPWMTEVAGSGAMQTPTERLFREVTGANIRLQLWQQAWQMFLGAPWLGVGFGQFDWNSFVLIERMPGLTVEPTEHAHNLLLHLLAELGVLAGVLSIGTLAVWLVRLLRTDATPERWWVLALLVVLAIHSMLEYPLWYTYFLGIASVLLGAGDQQGIRLALQRVGRPALAAMLVLGGLGLVSLTQSYLQLETWMQKGLRGQVTDRELPAISRDLMRVHDESLLSPYVELVFAASIELTGQQLDDKILLSEAAMRFSPIRHVVFRHVMLLALKGDHAGALVQLRRAMRAYPRDVPGFEREIRQRMADAPGVYDFLLNEIADRAKESER